ncbi:THAP domain-containing protein 2 [Syngnathus scovelli]|uniref:THAP domain-containing protein 2 n=1 Tax=Syngnathus scovelli TaxID=161590 RepID=UPI00210F79D4|nr:THAP domain-containing protein 2 [Syngnathus scovelli]XP_049588497.1 THAP domain-containing protein 2 [Syngnathus scovelli]XP_049588498.1 THAP domain-containing protein 2 [Syngnathus scovelli]
MPDFCAAHACSNERNLQTRSRGITFHKFPKSKERRRQWELAVRRNGFVANDRSLLCSEHFRDEDFDRSGQTVRLRDGVLPQIFNFPAHLQKPPVARRSTATSRRAAEPLPEAPSPACRTTAREGRKSQKRTSSDHLYALPSCPVALKAKFDAAMKALWKLQCEKRNALARQRRARKKTDNREEPPSLCV